MIRKINIYRDNGNKTVDARELYDNLNIGRDFPTWVRDKIKNVELIEDKDYIITSLNKPGIGRSEIHYKMSIEAAMKMVENMRPSTHTDRALDILSSIDSIEATATKRTKAAVKIVGNKKAKKTCNVSKSKNAELGQANPNVDVFIQTNELFGQVRFIKINGKEYAVGKDMAIALGYKDAVNAIKQHCKGVVKHHIPTVGGVQSLNIIPEGDMYRLIMNSKMPNAEKFERWVCDDVLPTIRKHGLYATEATIDTMLNDPDKAIEMLEKYKAEKQQKEALLEEKKTNEPKMMAYEEFINSDGLYAFATAAKILSIPRTATSNDIVGRNTFLAWLRRDGILISKGDERNTPYQRFINQGAFELKTLDREEGDSDRVTVRITPKGIEWLYKKYRYSNMPKKLEFNNEIQEEFDIAL